MLTLSKQLITLDSAVNLTDMNKAQLQQDLLFTVLVQKIFYQHHPFQFFSSCCPQYMNHCL